MSKGSVLVAVLLAVGGGFAIGHLTGRDASEEEVEALEADLADTEAEAGDADRLRVPVTDKQPSKGPKDALVTIVEFSDFECPFCTRVEPTITRILKEYKDKVRVVWRNNPLPFHQSAMPAAEAASEAFAQGGSDKFWKMHGILFANQKALGRADLEKYAGQVGLDLGKFREALDKNTHKAAVQADQALATRLDARGTPGFFINGKKLMGAQPYEEFKKVVDEELRRAEALVKKGVAKDKVYATLMKTAKTEATAEKPAEPEARKEPDANAVYKVPVGASPQKGPADALVTIIEFSDFECPFCSRVEPTMKQVMEKYGKDVRVAWKNNPLPFHKSAGPAAEAAMEAFAQGGSEKFWKMHELLFANQKALGKEELLAYGKQIGLNVAKLSKAIDTEAHKASIEADQKLARELGASGTPSFFINGRNLRGARPLESFVQVIDEELKKAQARVKAGTPRAKVYEETIKNAATAQQFAKGEAPGAEPGADKVYNIPLPAKAPRKGSKNAKVVIQEFSDFQCPFCSRVLPTMQQISREYGDKVQLIWRNYPLPFHQDAPLAAEASFEVFTQKGDSAFWKYHDLLFANQRALSRADLEKYAEQVGGVDMAKFKKALDDRKHQASVKEDMDAVAKAGAQIGTPSFFVNGKLVQGAVPFENFKAVIDAELKK